MSKTSFLFCKETNLLAGRRGEALLLMPLRAVL